MTEIIVFAVLLLIGATTPGGLGVAPQALYEAGLRRTPPPPCRELTPGELHEARLDDKGKASTYSLRGEYRCEHAIFDYGERDPYADFVIRAAPARAAAVARQAARLTAAQPELLGRPWSVAVRNGPAPLRPHLAFLYRQALAAALGAAAVARAPAAGGVTLNVRLRQVQDADLLFDVSAERVAPGGTSTWRF